MNDETRCAARVTTDFSSYGCSRKPTTERDGRPVCRQHAKVWDKWAAEERAPSMAAYWWEWKNDD